MALHESTTVEQQNDLSYLARIEALAAENVRLREAGGVSILARCREVVLLLFLIVLLLVYVHSPFGRYKFHAKF